MLIKIKTYAQCLFFSAYTYKLVYIICVWSKICIPCRVMDFACNKSPVKFATTHIHSIIYRVKTCLSYTANVAFVIYLNRTHTHTGTRTVQSTTTLF